MKLVCKGVGASNSRRLALCSSGFVILMQSRRIIVILNELHVILNELHVILNELHVILNEVKDLKRFFAGRKRPLRMTANDARNDSE